MKEVTIIIPRERTAVVVNFLQDEVMIRHMQLFTGVNCCQLKIQVPKAFVGTILRELDKIGCGVVYGTISVTSIDTIKPVPRSESIMKVVTYDNYDFYITTTND
jgi:predicted TIM-barrel enzyme